MDAMGDADELDNDEEPIDRAPFLTPESRAVTGAGLVLAALLSPGLFQFLSFFLFNETGGPPSQIVQYAVYGGPGGVMAAAGAAVAWPVRRWTGHPLIHALAVAAVIIGIVIAVVVAAGLLVASTSDDPRF